MRTASSSRTRRRGGTCGHKLADIQRTGPDADHACSELFLPLFETAFPKGVSQLLANAGHYSPEDAPADVAELVVRFVQGPRLLSSSPADRRVRMPAARSGCSITGCQRAGGVVGRALVEKPDMGLALQPRVQLAHQTRLPNSRLAG